MHASHTAISKSTPEIVLKSVFNRYDINGSGHLEFDAFALVLEDLGIESNIEQQALFALADSSNKRTIHFTEFFHLVQSNDFEHILSNQEDYLFVIETYESFLEYDVDRDGQITWNEFYFYLSKHGYSHEYISNYWYYMDQNGTGSITFEQFWRGFKAQSEAHKVKILHQQINQQIILFDAIEGEDKKQQISYKQTDQNNIFRAIKKQLKPVKRKKAVFKSKVGRVIEETETEDEDRESSHITSDYHDTDDRLDRYLDSDSDTDSSSLSVVMSSSDSDSSSDDERVVPTKRNTTKKTQHTKEIQNKQTAQRKETKSVRKQTKKTSNTNIKDKKEKEKERREIHAAAPTKCTNKIKKIPDKKITKSTNIDKKAAKSTNIDKKATKSTTIKEKKPIKPTQRKENKSVTQTEKIEDRKTKKETTKLQKKSVTQSKKIEDKKAKKETTKTQNKSVTQTKQIENKKTKKETIKPQNKSVTQSKKIDDKKAKKETTKPQNKSVTQMKKIDDKKTKKEITKPQNKSVTETKKIDDKKTKKETTKPQNKSVAHTKKIDDKKTKKETIKPQNKSVTQSKKIDDKKTKKEITKPQNKSLTETKKIDDKSVTKETHKNTKKKAKSKEKEKPKSKSTKTQTNQKHASDKKESIEHNRKHRSQSAVTQKEDKKRIKPKNDKKERQKQQRLNDIKIAKQRLSQRLSITDIKQMKNYKDKKRNRHAPEKSLNGFNLLKSLRIQSLQIGREQKQKELKRKLEKKKLKLKKIREKEESKKKSPTKKKKAVKIKRAVEMKAPTSHIRARSHAINSMAAIIDFKPNQRSHKYIFKHLHEKNNKLIAADSTKWDRNWTLIYKNRVKIAALKQKQREDKKKDIKILLAEKRAKAEQVNKAFMDAHYRLPVYKADDSHWDGHNWDKIKQSREEIAALKQRKRDDKSKDAKTLRREKQEKINEMNRAFINPHYKLNPLYAADHARWDRDWDKIKHSREEIAALKEKKRADKEKDFKTRQKEKKEKVDEVNQVFMDAHYKLPVYAADQTHWDRDWDKIKHSREEIAALKEKKRADKEKDAKTQRKEKKEKVDKVNQVFMDAHYKLPVYAANKSNWDLDWEKINKRRLEIKRLKQKRKDAKLNKVTPKKEREREHQKNDIIIAKKRLSKRLSLKLGTRSEDAKLPQMHPKMQTIQSEGVLTSKKMEKEKKKKEIPKKRLSKRLSLKTGIEAATIMSLLPESVVVHSIFENEEGNKMILELEPIEENQMNESFESECVLGNTHKKAIAKKVNKENRRFRSQSAFTRKDAKKLVKKKLVKPPTMLSKEDNKKRINAARDNLEDFMIDNGFWQIDFFLILVEFGINEEDDLCYISKRDKKEIIKLAKQKGLFSAKVKKFKAYLNNL